MNPSAREMGKDAWRNREPQKSNPFEEHSPDYLEWGEGWAHMQASASDYGLRSRRSSSGQAFQHVAEDSSRYQAIDAPRKCPECRVDLQHCEMSDGIVNFICPKCNESFGTAG